MTSHEPDEGETAEGPVPGEPSRQLLEAHTPENVPAETIEAHRAVAESLRAAHRLAREETVEGRHTGLANVQGVALGQDERGRHTLEIDVVTHATVEDVRNLLAPVLGRETARAHPLAVTVTGPIEEQGISPKRPQRMRPAYGGASASHDCVPPPSEKLTVSGTLCCLAKDKTAWVDKTVLLGCNHVFAQDGRAEKKSGIIQNSYMDAGRQPEEVVARLRRWVARTPGGHAVNYVDAAIAARVSRDMVRREIYDDTDPGRVLYLPLAEPIVAEVGMDVGKSGRTTGVTYGKIVAVNWSGPVGPYWYEKQIKVVPPSGSGYCAAGDSGSCVWLKNGRGGLHPVGMHFSGNGDGSVGLANPIHMVTDLLKIEILTGTGH